MEKKVKVLMCKLGLDIHWRGAVAVSRMMRDAGYEVVYIGNQFPEAIVNAAIQEGVQVVGMSTLGGNHLNLGPKVVEMLKEKGLDVMVLMGGVIPPDDIPLLKEKGIYEVFGPESTIESMVKCIDGYLAQKAN